jgi:hypothetical protein
LNFVGGEDDEATAIEAVEGVDADEDDGAAVVVVDVDVPRSCSLRSLDSWWRHFMRRF